MVWSRLWVFHPRVHHRGMWRLIRSNVKINFSSGTSFTSQFELSLFIKHNANCMYSPVQSRRPLNHYQMLFHRAFAKSSTKVMEFTLMFRAETLASSCLSVKQFGLELVSVDQTNVTAVMGHLWPPGKLVWPSGCAGSDVSDNRNWELLLGE